MEGTWFKPRDRIVLMGDPWPKRGPFRKQFGVRLFLRRLSWIARTPLFGPPLFIEPRRKDELLTITSVRPTRFITVPKSLQNQKESG